MVEALLLLLLVSIEQYVEQNHAQTYYEIEQVIEEYHIDDVTTIVKAVHDKHITIKVEF